MFVGRRNNLKSIKETMHILDKLVDATISVIGEPLVGIYLHGSLAMGCFNPKKSDLDILVVINRAINFSIKQEYMERIATLHEQAEHQGIELSVIQQKHCKPFTYPTPYELHFSAMYAANYFENPDAYVLAANGVDKDLAAHITILHHYGKCLYGKPIEEVFGGVPHEFYKDSIMEDIKDVRTRIYTHPMYSILNTLRVYAYQEKRLILSKEQAALWGLEHLAKQYHPLIEKALLDYRSEEIVDYKEKELSAFAEELCRNLKI